MDSIIYVSPHTDQYGAERSMIANIKNIMSHGIHVLLIIPTNGRIEELLSAAGIDYIIEKFYDVINHENRVRIHYGIGKQAVNTYKAIKVKKLLFERDLTPMFVHSNSLTSDFGIILSETLGVPHIQHIRELGQHDFGMTFDMGIKHFSKTCAKSQKIICISDAVRDYYKQYLPDEKLIRIYNGVAAENPDVFIPNRKAYNPLQLVMVGRVSEEKGQIQAIKAVQKLKDKINLHLDLWGDGVDKELLERYISENSLENCVCLCGYSKHISYKKYHIALMCSKCEAFGRVTVEYMFKGLPVIGSNTGGTKEIVVDGKTGLLYEQGNVEELADCIKALYDKEDLRYQLAINGVSRAQTEFSEKAYCEKVYEVYKRVCPDYGW